jgi:kynureninase
MPDRSDAEQLDAEDPLGRWRDEFVIADPDLIYLDDNSLGRTPRRTVTALRRVVEEQWAADLISSWWDHGWLDLTLTVGDELAPLIGARLGEVAVHESTTVGLFQLINVAVDLNAGTGRPVIAVDDRDFPTIRYVAEGVARLRSGELRHGLVDLDGVDVMIRSMVDYRTAEIADVAGETARAATVGCTTIWDLSHAVGVLDIDLHALGVDFAAGCTYKFLNGGPGAPAFVYVADHLHDQIVQPIWGWFGQSDQFAMDRPFEARPGIGRMLNGTPPVLGLTAAREGIRLTAEAGIGSIAAKARALTGFALDLADAHGLAADTPRDPAKRGGHVAVRHPDARRLHAELAGRKVIVDYRDPDVLRFGLSPLTTRFVDVYDAFAILSELA